MARHVDDLHPDDLTARIDLRARLCSIREQAGLTTRDTATRMGVDVANFRRLERQGVTQSRYATVARWARALDHRLVLTPEGFPNPVRWRLHDVSHRERTLTALVDTYNVAALGGHDGWAAAKLLRDLTGIRVACGISQRRLADTIGVTEQCVSLFEVSLSDPMLVMCQRYARAVAGACRPRRYGALLRVGLEAAGAAA